ncbi:MAG TPA: hypothetical protein VIB08_03210, partial [Thermoanaerobaculia bacterium]
LGAIAFAFSGVSVSEVVYTNYQPGFALLPWALLLFLRVREAPRTGLTALSLAFGLLFLAGDVITSSLAIGLCVLWTLMEVPRAQWGGLLRSGAAAVGLGVLIALPQIAATVAWVPHTTRSVLGVRFWEALIYSVSPFRLLELVVPFPFSSSAGAEAYRAWGLGVFDGKPAGFFLTFYCGALPVFGLMLARRERRGAERFALALMGISLLIAVPGVLLKRLAPMAVFPLPLRYPEKVMVLFTLGLAILAAIGFDRLRRGERLGRWALVVAAILASIAAVATFWPETTGAAAISLVGGPLDVAALAGREIASSFAGGGLLWTASLLAAWGLWTPSAPRAAVPLAIVVLTLVPIAANRRIAASYAEEDLLAPPAFARWVRREDPEGRFRVLGEPLFRAESRRERRIMSADPGHLLYYARNFDNYTHALWGIGTVFNNDFDHGDLSRLDTLRKISFAASQYRDSQSFWSTYALRFGVSYPDLEPIAGFRRIGGDALQVWSVNETALPAIRLAEKWREASSAVEAGASVAAIAPSEVLVETGRRAAGENSGRVAVRSQSPERLDLEVEPAKPGYLFVLRGYWPFRRVTVDGKPVETFPAQVAFTAVPIPAGRHEVAWEERLPGSPVSWAGPFAFLAVAAVASWRRGARPA